MSQTQGTSQVFTATPNSGDRFDYTQWRQQGLPKISLKELAAATKESIMQAQRLILETDDRGNLKQVPKLPPNQQFEVIFLVLAEPTEPSIKRRTPHPDLAGQVQILANNIIDSVPDSDWALPQ